MILDTKLRKDLRIGMKVAVVLKRDQPTGKRTIGHIKRILTNSPSHPHGIKVMLEEEDQVGRVQEVLQPDGLSSPEMPDEQEKPQQGKEKTEELLPLPNFPTGLYRHMKGKESRLLAVARHSETLEPMVVYQALYGERGIWVRPARMWDEMVLRDGRYVRRFTFLGKE